eukprot:TRINITY_DN15853_c0_g1_i1.p5 TRINITY_DN15853_c0_g1~~TRINITY_DN15853_c0_g1_i1.p5  ORF type:complete len:121 (-),score=19.33 TRINITY_DN15853_c0_g1_i1:632-994(-)
MILLISPGSFCFFFLMIRRPPRSTHCISSAASDVYKRQVSTQSTWGYGDGAGFRSPCLKALSINGSKISGMTFISGISPSTEYCMSIWLFNLIFCNSIQLVRKFNSFFTGIKFSLDPQRT